MKNSIAFVLGGNIVELRFDATSNLTPTTTVLNYLRSLPGHRGTKEGCAEGDCGACTVVLGELSPDGTIAYRAVDSCLLFLPMLHGKQLITIEDLRSPAGALHQVQKALVDHHGSQCGFCTPGIVMSIFALSKNPGRKSREQLTSALAGNLCRCTGYRPILQAAEDACALDGRDHFSEKEPHITGLLSSISQEATRITANGQRYDQPATLQECLAVLSQHPGPLVINGATDAALRVTKKFEVLPHVLDCSRVRELQTMTKDASGLTIGAGVRLNDVSAAVSDAYGALHKMLAVFGAQQIRNVATIGGNLGTASPVSDLLPVLMAYGTTVVLQSTRGLRRVEASSFVKGYRTTERRPDELIVALEIPRPAEGVNVQAYKVSRRHDLDIASVSAGFALDLDSRARVKTIILAYGGMADHTRRAESAERALQGKAWDRANIEEAQSCIDNDFDPISDVRGSAEFRRIAARNLLLKFWSETTV